MVPAVPVGLHKVALVSADPVALETRVVKVALVSADPAALRIRVVKPALANRAGPAGERRSKRRWWPHAWRC